MGAGVAAVAIAPAAWLSTWWLVGPGLAVAGLVVGVRHHRPAQLGPWKVLLASLVLFWVGWTVSAAILSGQTAGFDPAALAVARDLLYVAAYLGMGATALGLVRHRTGGADRDNLIDALVVVVALAMVLWASVVPSGGFAAGDLAGHEHARIVLEPLLSAAVVGAGARLVFAGAARLPSVWLLLAATLLVLAGNMWITLLVDVGGPTQAAGADVLWVLACVAVAAAALHPSMRHLTDPVALADQRIPLDRVVLFGLALLTGPAAHLYPAVDTHAEPGLFAGAAALVVVLILWRVVRLLREHERVRRALVATSRRDSVVVAVGERALSEEPLPQILAAADGLVRDAIAGVRCAVVPAGASEIEPCEGGEPELVLPVDDGHSRVADVVAAVESSRSLSPSEREFLTTIATLLSAAARQRTAEARLRHQALHDDLTGLPGRWLLLDRLQHALERRGSDPVVLLFVDLDGFKHLNDTWGHEAGDRVLTAVAERMRAAVRSHDMVARLAGDEFVVLVDDPDPVAVRPLIARLHAAAIDAGATLTPPIASSTLAASIGVAVGRPGEVTADQMLHRADQAMYRAKQHGGDRVAVCPWADPEVAHHAGLAGWDDEPGLAARAPDVGARHPLRDGS